MLAHMIGLMPKAAQLGHEAEERVVQNLMMAYTVENSEIAMYGAPAVVAGEAGDFGTEQPARSIQQEERDTAERVWTHLPAAARAAFAKMVGISKRSEEYRKVS